MLALIIAVLDDIYSIIAVWLNDCGKSFNKMYKHFHLKCQHQNICNAYKMIRQIKYSTPYSLYDMKGLTKLRHL